jgi:hypothetical protein
VSPRSKTHSVKFADDYHQVEPSPSKTFVLDTSLSEPSIGELTNSYSDSEPTPERSISRPSPEQYTGDEIIDSLRAIHEILDEANSVIQAYEIEPPPQIPTTVNVEATASKTKKKKWFWFWRNKNKVQQQPTAEEQATVAALQAAAARETAGQRRHVTGKNKEETFVWATQSLMRELDLIMPAFLAMKYRVNVNSLTARQAEDLAENTEVETLMPVTSKFLRKIDASVEGLMEKERDRSGAARRLQEQQQRGSGPCGVMDVLQTNLMGDEPKKPPKPLTAAQQRLKKEIEEDDRSAIVLMADMAEEMLQSFTMPDDYEHMMAMQDPYQPAEALYTRDISLLGAQRR